MKRRMIFPGTLLILLLFAIVIPARAQTAQAAKPAAPSRQQAADLAARKQLAAYMADFRNHPEDTELRDKIIELAKTLKPAPVIPQLVRADFAKAGVQMKAALTANDFKAVAKLFEQVAVKAPWYADAYYNAASAYAKAADLDSAKRNLALYLTAVRPEVDTQNAEDLQRGIEDQQREIERQQAIQQEQAKQEQAMQQFQRALKEFRANPSDSAREHIIKLAQTLNPKPTLSEGVHDATGRATYAFKNASSEADMLEAAEAYGEASQLAPWVPDYYFNQGVAYQQAKQFDKAITAFGWYLVAEPNAKDADHLRERIGGLKYATEKAIQKQAEEQKAAAAEEQKKRDYLDKIGFLAGTWNYSSTFNCDCAWNGRTDLGGAKDSVDITIADKTVVIAGKSTDGKQHQLLKGTIEGDDYSSIKWVLQAPQDFPGMEGAPDFPIDVTFDNYGHRIRWKAPSVAYPNSWSWQTSTDYELTK